MPAFVKISVENPDELLNVGAYGSGAIVRVQWSATEAGAFADIAGTGSTPTIAIVIETTSYTAYDPAGTSSTWYRTRYENLAATRLSDWSDAFQVGGEEAGSISSLYDIKQRLRIKLTDTANDELLGEFIRTTAYGIMGRTRRQFVRSPLSGTKIVLFDVPDNGGRLRTIRVPKGIATVTSLEVAVQTGAAFTVVPASDWFLDPPVADRDFGWPATMITLSDYPTGGIFFFYPGKLVVRVTGALGWSAIPGDIAQISDNVVIRQFLARGSGVAQALGSDTFGTRLLRWISPEESATLDWYRVPSA